MTDVSMTNDRERHTVDANTLECEKIYVARGKYLSREQANDRLYYLQMKYSRGVYSYQTALYLRGYHSELTGITMTFPQGYNVSSLKDEGITAKKLIPENYAADIEEICTEQGNIVRVYSLERTLCDLLRGTKIDYAVFSTAMHRYVASENRKQEKMLEIADRLRVRPKVLPFLEAIL